jgi:hypothetical protein
METEFTALASRVAARAEMLGCLILSRDGLVLGSFPPGGEDDVTPAWLRFSGLGQPARGFVAFEHELWAYVSHGDFGAFAVTAPSARAGVVLDVLEQVLMEIQEAHAARRAIRAPQAVNLTYPGPRESTALPPRPAGPHEAHEQREAPSDGGQPADRTPVPPSPPAIPPLRDDEERGRDGNERPEDGLSPDDIDRVALAREFAQLLQENPLAVEEDPEA